MLERCGIGEEGAMALGSALGPSALTELHLSFNHNLGDKGMAAVAQGVKFQGLRSGGGVGGVKALGLSSCGIGENILFGP